MNISQLKAEVIRQFAFKIVTIDDEISLKAILDFLCNIDINEKNAVNLSGHYNSIRTKYDSVLKRLAE